MIDQVGDETKKLDTRLVKRTARLVSGVEQAAWKDMSKEDKRPHMVTAKRVLRGLERYEAKLARGDEI